MFITALPKSQLSAFFTTDGISYLRRQLVKTFLRHYYKYAIKQLILV